MHLYFLLYIEQHVPMIKLGLTRWLTPTWKHYIKHMHTLGKILRSHTETIREECTQQKLTLGKEAKSTYESVYIHMQFCFYICTNDSMIYQYTRNITSSHYLHLSIWTGQVHRTISAKEIFISTLYLLLYSRLNLPNDIHNIDSFLY